MKSWGSINLGMQTSECIFYNTYLYFSWYSSQHELFLWKPEIRSVHLCLLKSNYEKKNFQMLRLGFREEVTIINIACWTLSKCSNLLHLLFPWKLLLYSQVQKHSNFFFRKLFILYIEEYAVIKQLKVTLIIWTCSET